MEDIPPSLSPKLPAIEEPEAEKEEQIYIGYDVAPEPVGGFEELQRAVVYPEIAREAGVEGTVLLKVLFSSQGEIIASRVVDGIPEVGFNEAAQNAIYACKWKPGIYKGEPVSIRCDIPVRFNLLSTENVNLHLDQNLSTLRSSQTTEARKDSAIMVVYDTPPEPLGGYEAIQKLVVYPEIAREAGIEGTVIVQARIGTDGHTKNCTILVGVKSDLDESAINAIKSIEWSPAYIGEKPIEVVISVPVVFRLKHN